MCYYNILYIHYVLHIDRDLFPTVQEAGKFKIEALAPDNFLAVLQMYDGGKAGAQLPLLTLLTRVPNSIH